jgi:ribose transport system permease protein
MTRENAIRWAPLLVLIGMILFTAINPAFLSQRNFARIAIAAAPALMVAIGVTFIIVMGSIDLSMEGTVGLTAVLFCFVFLATGGTLAAGAWVAIPVILVVGALIGLVNGLVHVKLRIPSFMASLAIGFVGTGAAVLITGGDIVKIDDDTFRALLTWRIAGFPLMVYVVIVMALIAWFIQSHTTLGRNFYAVGASWASFWRVSSTPSRAFCRSQSLARRNRSRARTSCSFPSPRSWSVAWRCGAASAASGTRSSAS